MTPQTSVQVNQPAPDFTLPDAYGNMVHLDELLGRHCVVLFFYPKDNTPACTSEACAFRDLAAEFARLGAQVLGISSDGEVSHRKFSERLRLPFPLLCDKKGTVRQRYGVPRSFGILPGRVTYVLDPQGIIRNIFCSQFQPSAHAEKALEQVRELEQQQST